MNERFVMPARLKITSMVLIAIGLLTIIIGAVVLLGSSSEMDKIRFWDALMHNSIYFLVVAIAAVFIIAAVTLAQGSWIVAYRRVPEAIGANVWLFGLIAMIVMFLVAFVVRVHTPFGDFSPIYKWMTPFDKSTGKADLNVLGKHAILNGTTFAIFTIITIGLWSYFGIKIRSLSLAQDKARRNSTKIYWKTFTVSGLFLVLYALTQMSIEPWMWVMSIDAHWYSTMFSWYSWASSFVAAMGVILLFVVYLKNQGYYQIINMEHIHDLGKFMFAFSIFWTYVWFDQFMLIWYANIPEETTYFKIRMQGPYSVIWFAVFIICFIMPILILMSRPSKRNYFTVSFMALVLFFGHWLDFYQMIYPGTMGGNWHIDWYEIGVLCGFIGTLIYSTTLSLSKHPLIPYNHPMLKEALIHVS